MEDESTPRLKGESQLELEMTPVKVEISEGGNTVENWAKEVDGEAYERDKASNHLEEQSIEMTERPLISQEPIPYE